MACRAVTLVALFLSGCVTLTADEILLWEDPAGNVIFTYELDGPQAHLSVESTRPWVQSVQVHMHGVNMRSEDDFPLELVLDGHERRFLTTFEVIEVGKDNTFYLDLYYVVPGILNATHDDSYVYELPYGDGEGFQVTQGYNGDFSHFDDFAYSLDFDMPEGTPLYAARDGWVVEVIEQYSEFGTTDDFRTMTNLVTILHEDGTASQYAHQRQGGVTVEVGDYVEVVDLISYSGVVGYTDDFPHLHFQVHRYLAYEWSIETLPTLFRAAEGSPIRLVKEGWYTSLNDTSGSLPGNAEPLNHQ